METQHDPLRRMKKQGSFRENGAHEKIQNQDSRINSSMDEMT
jgi:hypothetical protein